jgi:spoIIIJ-associated protein
MGRRSAVKGTHMSEQEITHEGAPDDSTESTEPIELGAREQAALDIMTELCAKTALDLKPVARDIHGQYVHIELVGDDAQASFGRNGKSLDSLQYLANLIVGRRVGGDVRVLLDAADYRKRREETLVSLAMEFADLVRERQEECELDPLPAHERRIIHNALSEVEGIRTYSEGDDPDRRVIIAPA